MQELQAKQEIYEVLCRYCRALDRMDRDMARAVWHADGTALYHDLYEGSGRGFVDWVWQAHAVMERHSHQIANHLILVDGDAATSEAYVTVTLWTRPDDDGSQQEIVARGRYLDQWSLRAGQWAIDHREHVLDMQTINPLTRGDVSAAAVRASGDPSYAYISTGDHPAPGNTQERP